MTKVENKADWYDRIAWGVVIPVFLLAVISLYGIWVATVNDPKMGSPVKAVITQAVWYLVSIALVIFVMQFDAEQNCSNCLWDWNNFINCSFILV